MKTDLLYKKTFPRVLFILLMGIVALAPPLQAQTGHWPFNSTFDDTSGNGLNGTPVMSPTFVIGVDDKAVSLDGSTQYITVADNDSLDFTTGITLAAWVRPNVAATQYIIKKAFAGTDDGYELSISSSGIPFFRLNEATSGSTYRINATTGVPTDGNTWMHIAATYDGNTMRIYINGVEDATSVPGPVSIVTNALDLGIGAQSDGLNKFNGAIDDAQVYDYALSSSAILNLATLVPPIPVLDSPADLSTGVIPPPTLNWLASSGAISYQLQVSTVSNFSTTVYDQSGITSTSQSVSGLSNNTTYYWRVNATNSKGTSDWSTVWSFTTYNPPSYETIGSGYSLNLDGINDYVDCGNNASADINGSITMEAWVKPTSNSITHSVIKKFDGSNGYELFLAGSGVVSARFNNANRLNSSFNYLPGEWIHVAATYNSLTHDEKLYINGVLDNSANVTFSIASTSNNLVLGTDLSSAGKLFTGQMDEVRLWNVERTQAEIQANMCKKLTGSETGLVGYWRFDETNGTAVKDEKNLNNGVLTNSEGDEHVRSGAAIGDDVASDYSGAVPGDFKASVTIGSESFTATGSGGTVTGIQVYRVDANSFRTGETNLLDGIITVDPLRFWGVRVFGSSATYDLQYVYTNHPGLTNEVDLVLAYRNNYADNDWANSLASQDLAGDSLTLTGQTGTEYTLGTYTDPLPVELSSFSASMLENCIKLNWRTETEVSNYGFEVQRSSENNKWDKLGFVEGSGNSNSPKDYYFSDNNVTAGKYSYRLKQIDNDGNYSFSKIVEVDFGKSGEYELSQNYPNPFNPVTTIKFTIPIAGNVKLAVYNILGEKVADLINEYKDAGVHTINFDATQFNSGLYIYKLESNGFVQTRKMLLIK